MPKHDIPRAWPCNITYLTAPIHSPTLTPSQLSSLRHGPPPNKGDGRPLQNRPLLLAPPVQIRPITNPTHPAHGQHGLFATRHLPPSTFILTYLGYVHGVSDTEESSDYDIALDREAGVSVDAARMGNEARFVNDYRGIRDEGPNAEFRDCWVGREKCVGVFVLGAGWSGKRSKGIPKGEEILVSYGRGFWRERASDAEEVVVASQAVESDAPMA